jgi:hypothetical protein
MLEQNPRRSVNGQLSVADAIAEPSAARIMRGGRRTVYRSIE